MKLEQPISQAPGAALAEHFTARKFDSCSSNDCQEAENLVVPENDIINTLDRTKKLWETAGTGVS